MATKERREYKRTPLVKPIRYSVTVSDTGALETIHKVGVSVNISKGGLGMITDYPLSQGHVLVFEDEIKITNISAKASIVRWIKAMEDNRYRVGLEFVR